MLTAYLTLALLAINDPPEPPQAPEPLQAPSVSTLSQKVKRVERHGLWYDQFPDGSLEYCKECNKGKVPARGITVSKEEHEALTKAGATFVAVQGVTAHQPFRSVSSYQYDPDHQCNKCGAYQFVISGWNADGTHNHVCPACGNVWYH